MTYTSIASINGHNNPGLEKNHYSITDPELLKNVTWYRFKMIDSYNKFTYSNVVRLVDSKTGISIQSLSNPFSSELRFEIVSGVDDNVSVDLINHNGQKVRSRIINVRKGSNNVVMENTDNLVNGFYVLRVSSENTVIHRKLVKARY